MKAIIQGTAPGLWSALEGIKTYLAIAALVGYPFLCRILDVPVDEDIRGLLLGMVFAAFRSGNKTDSEKVVTAVANPAVVVAQVPTPAPNPDLTPEQIAALRDIVSRLSITQNQP